MNARTEGHGGLALATLPLLLVGGLAAPVRGSDPARPTIVRSTDTLIDYEVPRGAQPLTAVQLWYTEDRGASWTAYGFDEDGRSPARFVAPGDGLFGLFLIIENATGRSSQPPTPRTEPHLWLLVDRHSPVVQLHPLRQTTSLGRPTIQIRWTAVDTQFPSRPIEIEYRIGGEAAWRAVEGGPLGNTGRFDWTVPDAVTGRVDLRIAARDLGGHRSVSEPRTIVLAPEPPRTEPVRPTSDIGISPQGSGPPGSSRQASPALSGSPRAQARAVRLFEEAMTRRDDGDLRSAIARLREAVRLDPQNTDAFAEMAGMFYRLGEWDRALGAYDIVLKQQPRLRSALLGSALAHAQKKDYSAAGDRLRTILRHSPNDAEVWMNLGDVAIYGGDEVLARDCYTRASQIEPSAADVIDSARRRLALMNEVSRGR